MVVGAVEHESELRLDRAAREDAHAAGDAGRRLTQHLQEACKRTLLERSVNDDAHGPVAVVQHEQDNGLVEARIAHVRRGDQELACERRALGSSRQRGQCCAQERRQYRRGDEAQTLECVREHGITPAGASILRMPAPGLRVTALSYYLIVDID
jgi:hypothetical protein